MMRHVFVSLLMLGVLVLPSCASAAPKQATVLLVGNYWDGVSDAPLGAAEILVVDGRIAEQGGPELADRLEDEGYDRFLVSA